MSNSGLWLSLRDQPLKILIFRISDKKQKRPSFENDMIYGKNLNSGFRGYWV